MSPTGKYIKALFAAIVKIDLKYSFELDPFSYTIPNAYVNEGSLRTYFFPNITFP